MNCDRVECKRPIRKGDSCGIFVISEMSDEYGSLEEFVDLYDFGFSDSMGCVEKIMCDDCANEWAGSCEGVCTVCKRFMCNPWVQYKKKRYCQLCIPSIRLTSSEVEKLSEDVRDMYLKGKILTGTSEADGCWTTKIVFKLAKDRVVLRKALERTISSITRKS